jgi:hypothetical protein
MFLKRIAVDISQSPQRNRQKPPISTVYAMISIVFEISEVEI